MEGISWGRWAGSRRPDPQPHFIDMLDPNAVSQAARSSQRLLLTAQSVPLPEAVQNQVGVAAVLPGVRRNVSSYPTLAWQKP